MILTIIEFHSVILSVNKWFRVEVAYDFSVDSLPTIFYFSDLWNTWTVCKLNISANVAIVGVVIPILVDPVYVINFRYFISSLVFIFLFSSG